MRSSAVGSIPDKLRGRDLWLWHPHGGRCPVCNSADITSVKQLIPAKVVYSDEVDGAWHSRLISTRRRCGNPQCQHCFSSLNYKYIDTLPDIVSDGILSRFVLGKQSIIPVSIIRRLRDGGLVSREAEVIRGLESVALGRRRAFFNEYKRRCENGTLISTVSASAREICRLSAEEAIPDQPARISHLVLKYALLKDFELHKADLLRELSSHKVQFSLSIDHTRSVPKRVGTNRNGYLVVFVADGGMVLNAVSTESTSMAELGPALAQLKDNMSTDVVTIFVDRDCCQTVGDNNRRLIAKALDREPETIELKLDALHCIFRLLRNTADNHPRQNRFATALSKCFFIDNEADLIEFRAQRARAGLVSKPSRSEMRRHVRRVIPQPVELRRRLEVCIRSFWELDCEGEASTHQSQREEVSGRPLPGSVGVPLFKDSFWPTFRSVLVHVDNYCISDTSTSTAFVRDAQGGLRHVRGSSRSECRHACIKKDFSQTSRISGVLHDCKLLWRMVYSNRRLKMKMEGGIDGKEAIPIPLSSREYRFAATAGSSINVTSQKAKIVFGDEYLALTNKQRYQAICKEWENERKKDEESSSASDNEEDGNPTNDQESAIMKWISGNKGDIS